MDAERREYLEMQLSAYLDGELTPQERAEVEAWLEADPKARQLLGQLRATVDVVHSLPRARASEELLGNLRTRLERQALLDATPSIELHPGARTRLWGRWLAVAAVISLTFTAGYFTWTLREEKPVGPQYAWNQAKRGGTGKANGPAVRDGSRSFNEARAKEEKPETEESSPPTLLAAAPAAEPPAASRKPTAEIKKDGDFKAKLSEEAEPAKQGPRLGTLVTNGEVPFIAGLKADEDGLAKNISPRDEIKGIASLYDLDDDNGDGAADGGATRILAMQFADADGRAKVIDDLSRVQLQQMGQEGGEPRLPSAPAPRPVRPEGKSAGQAPVANAPARRDWGRSRESAPRPTPGGIGSDVLTRRAQTAPSIAYGTGGTNATGSMSRFGGGMGGFGGMAMSVNGAVRIDSIKADRSSRVNIVRMNAADQAAADKIVEVLSERAQADGAIVVGELAEDKHRIPLGHEANRRIVRAEEPIGGQPEWDSLDSREFKLLDATVNHLTQSIATPQPQPESVEGLTDSDRYVVTEKGDDVPAVRARASKDKRLDNAASRPAAKEVGRTIDGFDFSAKAAPTPAPAGVPAGSRGAVDSGSALRDPYLSTSPAGGSVADEGERRTRVRQAAGSVGYVFDRFDDSRSAGYYERSGRVPATQPASATTSKPVDGNLLVVYLRVAPPESRPATPTASSVPAATQPASRPAGVIWP